MERGVGLVASAVAAFFAVELVWAASGKIGVRQKEAEWAASQFVSTGLWAGIAAIVAVVAAVVSLRGDGETKITHLVEVLAALGVSFAAAYTLSAAVEAERANYWDAIHFSSLVWIGFLTALGAAVVSGLASRRGDRPVVVLGWLPGFLVALWVLLWLVTWFEPLGDFIAWIASRWYLATHG